MSRSRFAPVVLALAVPVLALACGKEAAPAGGPTDGVPSATASASDTPTTTGAPSTTAAATAPASAAASAPASATAGATATAAPSSSAAAAFPKFDPSCKADADCELYMEGSAKDPCCPVCPNWRAASKPSVAAFKKACSGATACPVSCASVAMKAVCKAGACSAVPAK